MSGHSKWATIKHKKGAADKARGKLFAKLARQIEVAARAGGGDVDSNAALRTMVLKAKAGQMTKDAIDRAIKRGIGENDGANYESITYEGYAPGGVAMLVDVLTDNRNRTAADVLYDVKDALDAAGIEVQSAESTMVSSTTIEVTDVNDAKQILRIMDLLEDNDDVQDVYANFDMDESIMQGID